MATFYLFPGHGGIEAGGQRKGRLFRALEWAHDLPGLHEWFGVRPCRIFRRISGRLYEIGVHPIQSLHSAPSRSADSAQPGICKERIGQAVAQLRDWGGTEESLADRLTADLCLVYTAVRTISDLYDGLDDNSQENVFVSHAEAQTQLAKATSAIDFAVFVTIQWLASAKPTSGQLYTTAEELKSQVKRMGRFFQLLIQGCDKEIPSMVTDAQRKSSQCLDAALKALGHLAAMTGVPLHTAELGARATGKLSVTTSLLEGTNRGVRSLLEEGLRITKEMLREAQLSYQSAPALQSVKSRMLDLASALQRYLLCSMTERESSPEKVGKEEEEEEADASQLHRSKNMAAKLFQLNQAVGQLHGALSSALRGDCNLSTYREAVCSSTKTIDEVISGLPKGMGASPTSSGLQLPLLHFALRSLSTAFSQQGAG